MLRFNIKYFYQYFCIFILNIKHKSKLLVFEYFFVVIILKVIEIYINFNRQILKQK